MCCHHSYLISMSVGHVQYLHCSVSTRFICRHICTDGNSARTLSQPSESLLQGGSCSDVLQKAVPVLIFLLPHREKKACQGVEFTAVSLLKCKKHSCFPAHWEMQRPGAEAVSGLTFLLSSI